MCGKRVLREEWREMGITEFSSPHTAKENVIAWIPAPPEVTNETYTAPAIVKSFILPFIV